MTQSPLHKLSPKDELEDTSLLRTLIDSLPEQVYVKDLQGRYVLNNLAHVRALGAQSPEEVAGKSDPEFYPKELAERYRADEQEVMRSGRPLLDRQEPSVDEEGNQRWYSITKVPLRDGGGEIVGLVGIGRDVTERKETEEALKESEERFRSLTEATFEAIAIIERGKILEVNRAYTAMFGYEPSEIVGKPAWEPVAPESVELVRRNIFSASEEPYEAVMLRKDGTLFDAEVRGRMTSYRGRTVRVTAIRDITERKHAEERLRESEERFRSLIQNALDLITILGEDGTIVYESPAVERILGYRPEERVGRKAFDYVHPDDRGQVVDTFAEALENPGQVQQPVEFRLRHKDGSWRHVETRRTNLLDDPAVKGVVANSRDITERRQAEEALRESEERYRAVVEQSAESIWLFDPDTKQVLESNTAFQRMLGYTAEELQEMTIYEVVAHSREDVESAVEHIMRERRGFFGERKYRRKDGTLLDVDVSGTVIPYQGKEVICSVVRDLTERKKAEEALKESEERFRSAFEDSPVGVALVGLDGRRFRVNRALCQMLGYPQEGLLGKNYLETIHPDDREESAEHLQQALEGGAESYSLERRYIHADGHVVWNLSSVSVVRDSQGEPSHFVCLHQDITERKALEEQFEHRAFHDSLTELPNRALFLDRLGHALARARRGGPVAVLLVDLDDFKVINDSLGHDAGNALLVKVAERLKDSVRPGDTVGRIFGDEFAVLLEAPADVEEARRVADRVGERLQEPFEIEGQEVFVRSSIGIALGDADEDTPEEALLHADLAMYTAKSHGKARYEVYSPSMNRRAVERMDLENELRRAVEREEFEVYYQPIVELGTGKVVAFEALARWKHPERGLVEAEEFIQVAEETGLIRPIGGWVLEEACRQAREWRERYRDGAPLMSVNFSASQFSRQPNLVSKVLKDTGLDPQGLQLEMTERVVMDDAEFSIGKLKTLKGQGVSLAIDDYGTGYSCLYYLKRMPVDHLKIDRAFIAELGKDPGDEAIVSGTIGLAHALGLKVVAEGVETEEQHAKLKKLGCDLAQGYHFAKPLHGEVAERWLGLATSSGP